VSRHHDAPKPLGELLNIMAGRLRKVDLRVIDEVRQLWPTIVDPVLAEHCRPEFVKNGVLLVTVPSGAFAQRITLERESILLGLAPLGDRAPTTLRTVLADP
jgi:predicted nucleic acid-binding Zn ribbon protein